MTLFEKILAKQLPATFEHEDDWCAVIRDVDPKAPLHLLVIPRKPIATLNDLTAEDVALVGHLFLVARDVANRLGYPDYRAVFNCGAAVGQAVFHLHLHVLAGRPFAWPPG